MIRKEYKYGREARESIKRVAQNIGDVIGKTLGPAGRNYQTPSGITNDGSSILEHIRFADECDDNVSIAFHEVAKRTDQDGGDGTTTATVIATKLVEDIIETVPDLDSPTPGATTMSVMDIGRRLEEEKDIVIGHLKDMVVPVTTLEELEKVAFTSMEDKDAAKIVADTIFKAGPNSYTALEEGFTGKLETNVQAGLELPLSIAAPFMYNEEGKRAQYEGAVPVLVANHVFEDYREINPFLQSMMEAMKNNQQIKFPALVIIGKQFSIPFVQTVMRVYNGSQGQIRILLVSNTHLSDDLFEDAAAFVNAKHINTHPKGNTRISDAKFADCGLVSKIVVTEKGTVLYGGKGTQLQDKQTTTRVQARILEIQGQLAEEKDVKKREAFQRRIAEFQGGKATIYVDAKTAAEKYYVRLKVQDCMNSCKAALEGGMIPGGGVSLRKVAALLPSGSLLAGALQAPYDRIQQNAGGSLEISPDVMDSFLVAKAGIENAVSVVKTLITIEGIIADHPKSMVDDLGDILTNG